MGIIAIISKNVLGLVGIGGFYFFLSQGIEINFDKKKYRNFISLFHLDYGKWEDLPEIDYISVFKTEQTTKVWVSSASANITDTVIRINLFHSNNQKIEAYETQNIDDAFKKAKQIATILDIDILDATEQESKWL